MQLRVMTYNILDGGEGREELILKVLKAIQPDLLLLQEVTRPRIAHHLTAALGMHLFFAKGNSKRHMALLSRFPIVSSQSYHPLIIRRTIIEAEVKLAPDMKIYVFGVHLVAAPALLFEQWRKYEVKALINRTKRYQSTPVIVAGDFNSVAPHDRFLIENIPLRLRLILKLQGWKVFRYAIKEMLVGNFHDCYRELHPSEDGFTLPPPVPKVRIDYIFANQIGRNHLRRCSVVHSPPEVEFASDHYPVIAEFDFD